MIATAKREPQGQAHKFILSSCPAVTWLSLSRAPGLFGVSHTENFSSDCGWQGLHVPSAMAPKSCKPKRDNDLTTTTPVSQLWAFLHKTIAGTWLSWVTLFSLTPLLCSSRNTSQHRPNPTPLILAHEINYRELLLRLQGPVCSHQASEGTCADTSCIHHLSPAHFFPLSHLFSKRMDFQTHGLEETKQEKKREPVWTKLKAVWNPSNLPRIPLCNWWDCTHLCKDGGLFFFSLEV